MFERAGNWPVWQQILKELHKETALHRASLYAGGENAYDPEVFLDPVERRSMQAAAEQQTEFFEESSTELFDVMGWS